jgi:hypothetical protein
MKFKVSKEKQDFILTSTMIIGLIAWTFLSIGFYSLEKKQQIKAQKKAIKIEERRKAEEASALAKEQLNVSETVDQISENSVKEEVSPKQENLKPVVTRPAPKKTSIAPRKVVAQNSQSALAPGVRFTNDRNKVSCKSSGGDHDKSEHGKKSHYDEDCCIDKDEWLMPGCTYHYNDIKYSLNGKKPFPSRKPIRK